MGRSIFHGCRARLVWLAMLSALIGGAACSHCTLSVSTKELPDAVVGVNYVFGLSSDCGGDVWFLQTGNLPPGIGLRDNGNLVGVPTDVGRFQFTVGVFDFSSGQTAFKGFVLQVDPEP
jgi:hypothetical protein